MYWRRKAFRKFAENPDLDGIKFKFEPDNKHDKYAVAIKFRGKLICYVPRRITAALSYYSREARRRVFVANLEHTTGELRFDICLLRGNAAFEDIPLKSKKPIKGKPCRDSVDCFIPPLVRAVKEMCGADKISALIASEKNLDRAGEHWGTPLIAAVKTGSLSVVEKLLAVGSNVNVRASHLWAGCGFGAASAVAFAAVCGDFGIFSAVMKARRISTENLWQAYDAACCLKNKTYIGGGAKGVLEDVVDVLWEKLKRRGAFVVDEIRRSTSSEKKGNPPQHPLPLPSSDGDFGKSEDIPAEKVLRFEKSAGGRIDKIFTNPDEALSLFDESNVNIAAENTDTPFAAALRVSAFALADSLLALGAVPEADIPLKYGSRRINPLALVCRDGNIAAVKYLLSKKIPSDKSLLEAYEQMSSMLSESGVLGRYRKTVYPEIEKLLDAEIDGRLAEKVSLPNGKRKRLEFSAEEVFRILSRKLFKFPPSKIDWNALGVERIGKLLPQYLPQFKKDKKCFYRAYFAKKYPEIDEDIHYFDDDEILCKMAERENDKPIAFVKKITPQKLRESLGTDFGYLAEKFAMSGSKFEFCGDVNERIPKYGSYAILAAVNGFHLLLKLLICAGADMDFGYWQIRRGMPEDLFYYHTDRATPLQVATENGDVVAAKIILKYAKLSPEDLDFSAELASEKSGNAYPDRGNVYDVIGRKIDRVRRRAAKARIGAFLKTRSIAGLTGGDIVEIIEKYPKMRKSWDVPDAWRKLSAADWAKLLPVFEPECIRYCRESDGIGWRLRFRAKLKKLGSPVGLPEIFIPEDSSKRGKTIMIY